MVHQKSHGCFELLKILSLLYAHNVVAIGNVVLRLSGDSYRQHKQLKCMHACMHAPQLQVDHLISGSQLLKGPLTLSLPLPLLTWQRRLQLADGPALHVVLPLLHSQRSMSASQGCQQ